MVSYFLFFRKKFHSQQNFIKIVLTKIIDLEMKLTKSASKKKKRRDSKLISNMRKSYYLQLENIKTEISR
jgi:hypothetical protein